MTEVPCCITAATQSCLLNTIISRLAILCVLPQQAHQHKHPSTHTCVFPAGNYPSCSSLLQSKPNRITQPCVSSFEMHSKGEAHMSRPASQGWGCRLLMRSVVLRPRRLAHSSCRLWLASKVLSALPSSPPAATWHLRAGLCDFQAAHPGTWFTQPWYM